MNTSDGNRSPNSANIQADKPKRYDAAIYFENDPCQIEQVEAVFSNILQTIRIAESPVDQLRTDLSTIAKRFNLTPENNVYLEMQSLKAIHLKQKQFENFDSKSGIQLIHIEQLRNWINDTDHLPQRVALFDWDRTITMFESIKILEPEFKSDFKGLHDRTSNRPWTVYDVREHTLRLALSPLRLGLLRQTMSMLFRKNIDIVLITNNQGCVDDKFGGYWRALVDQFFGSTPYKLISSLRYHGNKGFALLQELPQLHPSDA